MNIPGLDCRRVLCAVLEMNGSLVSHGLISIAADRRVARQKVHKPAQKPLTKSTSIPLFSASKGV